jgi:hypothetical protein
MKNELVKIALAYRGQIRNHQAGVIWKQRLIDDFKSIMPVDVKTFCHTSKTESSVHALSDPDPLQVNLAETVSLTEDETLSRLRPYKPAMQRIFNHPHIYQMAGRIIDYWTQHREFADFLIAHNDRPAHFITRILNINNDRTLTFLGRNRAERENYFVNQIYLGNFISQYISAGHSVKMIDAYAAEKEWSPDLVISLRYDTAMTVLDPQRLLRDALDSDYVYGNGVIITKGHGHSNDLAFAMNYPVAESFLGDIDDRIYGLLTDWRVIGELLMMNDSDLSHNFWNLLLRGDTKLGATPFFRSALIRAGFEEQYDPVTASIDDVRTYFLQWRDGLAERKSQLPRKEQFGKVTLDDALRLLNLKYDDVF